MNIVFLTTADAIYLPAFFDRVLRDYGSQTRAVHIVPPLYKGQTAFHAFWRYLRTFGLRGVWSLIVLMARAKADGPRSGRSARGTGFRARLSQTSMRRSSSKGCANERRI